MCKTLASVGWISKKVFYDWHIQWQLVVVLNIVTTFCFWPVFQFVFPFFSKNNSLYEGQRFALVLKSSSVQTPAAYSMPILYSSVTIATSPLASIHFVALWNLNTSSEGSSGPNQFLVRHLDSHLWWHLLDLFLLLPLPPTCGTWVGIGYMQ